MGNPKLKEPVPNHISARKRQRQRPYAIRKPKDYGVSLVGDLVQLDTLDVSLDKASYEQRAAE